MASPSSGIFVTLWEGPGSLSGPQRSLLCCRDAMHVSPPPGSPPCWHWPPWTPPQPWPLSGKGSFPLVEKSMDHHRQAPLGLFAAGPERPQMCADDVMDDRQTGSLGSSQAGTTNGQPVMLPIQGSPSPLGPRKVRLPLQAQPRASMNLYTWCLFPFLLLPALDRKSVV